MRYKRYLLPSGRIRRRDFLALKILLVVFGFAAFLIPLITIKEFAGTALLAWLIVSIYLDFVLFSKRLHDLDYNAFWTILLLVPFANLAIVLFAFFYEGTIGENRFGPDPIKDRKQPQAEIESEPVA